MKLVDLNVLLYAVNEHAPRHQSIRSWWESALVDDEPIGLPWVVLLGFLRISTNARVFPDPLSSTQAMEQVEEWLSHPNVRIMRETEEHWRILRQLLEESGTAGNLTTDAHLAALAISHGAALASCDADFGRYRHLRWVNPAAN